MPVANGTYVWKALPTPDILAVMWFLSGMCSNVYCQGASLNEALSTVRVVTGVWSFIGMDPVMPLQIWFPIEALGASQSLRLCCVTCLSRRCYNGTFPHPGSGQANGFDTFSATVCSRSSMSSMISIAIEGIGSECWKAMCVLVCVYIYISIDKVDGRVVVVVEVPYIK